MQQIRISIGDGIKFIERILTIADDADAESAINQLLDAEIDESWGNHILILQSAAKEVSNIRKEG